MPPASRATETRLCAREIEQLSYVEVLALLREENRPPGGLDTIRRLVGSCHLRPGIDVLHAGCNAGFLTRELARRSGASVRGIDLSPAMVQAARTRSEAEGLSDAVGHDHMDMRNMTYDDASFDVVLSGGALAFVDGQRQAVAEWSRVVRQFGLLADAELFYKSDPPDDLRQRVGAIIGAEVPRYDKEHWRSLLLSGGGALYDWHEAPAATRSAAEVHRYATAMAARAQNVVTEDAVETLAYRLEAAFQLFNENLSYMDYCVIVVRQPGPDSEPDLYL